MNTKSFILSLGIAAFCGALAIAATSTESAPADQGEMQLPTGWTMEDMQAVMMASTPGKMHERLAQDIGTWDCETTMWMAPNTEPMKSGGTATYSPLMDGRFIKCDMEGEMPGMGPYHGMGICGYDNVSQEFICNWMDNHGTGIMNGVGELSDDGKTLTWEFTYNCPITKKPVVMREVETVTGPDTKTFDMFGADPKSGEEFKMMHIDFTRK
ncbi:DUF1579 domain-containing protein [Bythopirellula polymerisocia]|uniref:DUF1579 domain-containing protein n=1 Tax=Bythopirellula polymerisocia TaxID=2528003 RepID=A0A5C6D0C1_9BACT|nr:DUF1579 domain-containing protein [Bythopirellula polymerisocia]TWU29274.1 hypothetical protein Pla144_00500 [Bythopirellula polymerisocia]